MEQMQIEGLRIQVENDYSKAPESQDIVLVPVDNNGSLEDAFNENKNISLVDEHEGIERFLSNNNNVEEDGEIASNPDESMEVDLSECISVECSQQIKCDSPTSPAGSSDINVPGTPNSFVGERKTRRYLNPFIKKDLNKLTSRADRFGNADAFANVEYDEERLGSRAQRFGLLKEDTVSKLSENSTLELPSDEKLLDLYFSVGLIPDVGGKISLEQVDPKFRLDSILIRGTNNMSTNEIFKYLSDNNLHPLEMEWVNDACCVVIYKDNYEAAASLVNITKPILIEPTRKKSEEISQDSANQEEGEINDDDDEINYHETDVISSRLIKVPMPPGYVWRFAVPCSRASGILMRFANTNDKKQEKSERHSIYYKKHGNPNYGGVPAFFTASPKSNKPKKITKISPDTEVTLSKIPIENKYAWSDLSAEWGEEERAEEVNKTKGNNLRDNVNSPRSHFHSREPRRLKSLKVRVNFGEPSTSIKSRLKRKRDESSEDDVDVLDGTSLIRRLPNRTYSNSNQGEEDSDDEIEWNKKLRGPVMRMHADDEEQRIRRKTKQRKVSLTSFHPSSPIESEPRMKRALDIHPKSKRRSIKDRLGGPVTRNVETSISFEIRGGQDDDDYVDMDSEIRLRSKLKKRLADRLGKRESSHEDGSASD